jgi:hypothetical protein
MEKERFCEKCKKTHVDFTTITNEEANSFRFINTRAETAQKWVREAGVNQNVVMAAMQLESDSIAQAQQWWKEISEKYNFKLEGRDIKVEFDLNTLYYDKE